VIRSMTAATAAIVALGGCMATTPEVEVDPKAVKAYLADKPAETRKLYAKVMTEGENSRVEHLLRASLATMELGGHNDLAAQTFDDALLTIDTIFADNEEAEKARSNFNPEDAKIFRGEPYERAMAFYYRGVLYLMEGDYENARASFKSGVLQDSLAEKEQFRADFALLDYLTGWASQCNGNAKLAADAYATAKEHDTDAVLPGADHNVLVLSDQGYAPVKYGDGEHKELLKVKKNAKNYTPNRAFQLDGSKQSLANQEDVLRQATTRGGREFDFILEGKAKFKEGAEDVAEAGAAVAQAGMMAGMAGLASGNEDLATVGGGMAALGGLVSIFASAAAEATKPEADTRQWDNLPESIFYGTYRVDAAGDAPGIEGLPGGRGVHRGGDERCQVVWARNPATSL